MIVLIFHLAKFLQKIYKAFSSGSTSSEKGNTMTASTKLKKRLSISVLLLSLVVFGSLRFSSASSGAVQRGEFMIVNKSSFTFAQLYISSSTRRAWGRDQLGRRIVRPGESFTLRGIPCGLYDIRLVDEDGDSCIVTEIPMCRNHTHWEVTNDRLLSCQGFQ